MISKKYIEAAKAEVLKGYQLRYIYFIDKRWRGRLTVPAIPFSKIDEVGAGMYKVRNINVSDRR